VKKITNTFDCSGKNVSIDNRLWMSQVQKLDKLVELYREILDVGEDKFDSPGGTLEETLCLELMTDIEDVQSLMEVLSIDDTNEESLNKSLTLYDLLTSFHTEGDLQKDFTSLRMKSKVSPSFAKMFYNIMSSFISTEKERAIDLFQNCCLNIEDMTNVTLQGFIETDVRDRNISLTSIRRLFQTLSFLLTFNSNVDDKQTSLMQEIIRKVLRRQDMTKCVYLVGFVWKCVLLASNYPSVILYAEDWTRKLQHIKSFLSIKKVYLEMLNKDDAEDNTNYSLSGVFENGDGRISEILSNWLWRLGVSSRDLIKDLETVSDDNMDQETVSARLVEAARSLYPRSSDVPVLLLHLCWIQLQSWSRDRDSVNMLQDVSWSVWNISSPQLRLRFISLLWKTHLQEMVRDCAKMTESLSKTVGGNKSEKCSQTLAISSDNVPKWLCSVCAFLDCHLQTLNLTNEVITIDDEDDEDVLAYDNLSHEKSTHLLHQIHGFPVIDGDTISLYQQLTLVLEISWTLRLSSRPLSLFTTSETHTLLATQPGLISSIFTDHNSGVNNNRKQWILTAADAGVGRIHCLKGGEYELNQYQEVQDKLQTVARNWFMSDYVKLCQVESLYKAGYDDIAGEVRTSISDQQTLGSKLLEVCLMRLAKHVWSSHSDSQGRLAAVPSSLVSHLAERKSESCSVADSSLVDTVGLLGWVASCVEAEDQHSLATQALSAAQVLQVRSNRQSGDN